MIIHMTGPKKIKQRLLGRVCGMDIYISLEGLNDEEAERKFNQVKEIMQKAFGQTPKKND